jgi:hypothetical protein
MLTLFTFGYCGWGNATRELVKAIDATERRRGFKPPIFFDIRYHRNVRAVGFNGDSFAQLLPRGRYHWFPCLGNKKAGGARFETLLNFRVADPLALRGSGF